MTPANLINVQHAFPLISPLLSVQALGRLQRVDRGLKECVDSVAREILDMLRDNHQTHLRCLGMWETIESSTPTINNVNLISSRLLQISGQDKDTAVDCSILIYQLNHYFNLIRSAKEQEAKNHLKLFQSIPRITKMYELSKLFQSTPKIAKMYELSLPDELIEALGREAGEAYCLNNPNALFEWMEENKNTLRSIQNIYLSDFKGTTLPKEFLDFFPNLKELTLHDCPQLRGLPNNFLDKCTQLEKLDIRVCPQLKALPDGFLDKCSKLECFYLSDNRALWSDPDDTKNREEILQRLLTKKVQVHLDGSPYTKMIDKKRQQKELLIPSVMLIALSIVLLRARKAYRSY